MAGSSGKAPWRKRVLSTSWAQWQGEESGGWGTEWRLGEGPHQGKQQGSRSHSLSFRGDRSLSTQAFPPLFSIMVQRKTKPREVV